MSDRMRVDPDAPPGNVYFLNPDYIAHPDAERFTVPEREQAVIAAARAVTTHLGAADTSHAAWVTEHNVLLRELVAAVNALDAE